MMDPRENFLRAAEMRQPEWIPCSLSVSPPLWQQYREGLENLVLEFPAVFGEYKKGSRNFDEFGVRRKGNVVTDAWGCVWTFLADGLQGQVIKHPLEDWKAFDSYTPPDPIASDDIPQEGAPPSPRSLTGALNTIAEDKRKGRLAVGHCPHGFMFQRLYYLRGFNNLMKDFVVQPPQLLRLVRMVLDHNMKITREILEAGVDLLSFGDDIGMQDRLTVHPATLRKYILPAYSQLFRPAREKGVHVRLHSDGHWMEVADDLMAAGVNILNPQDLVNGVDNIRKRLKGKVCIDVDLDRQTIVPFGKPHAVKKHVQRVVSALNSPQGGFMITVDIYPPTPLKNIEALCQALEAAGAGVKQ